MKDIRPVGLTSKCKPCGRTLLINGLSIYLQSTVVSHDNDGDDDDDDDSHGHIMMRNIDKVFPFFRQITRILFSFLERRKYASMQGNAEKCSLLT